jgi:hypothetical protein
MTVRDTSKIMAEFCLKQRRSFALNGINIKPLLIFSFSVFENVLSIAAMEEGSYRWRCRVLGNPVAFTIVCLLVEHEELTPSDIARAAENGACCVLVIFWPR